MEVTSQIPFFKPYRKLITISQGQYNFYHSFCHSDGIKKSHFIHYTSAVAHGRQGAYFVIPLFLSVISH